jgi:hypothetical protein
VFPVSFSGIFLDFYLIIKMGTFIRMNTKAYEHCIIAGERIDIPAGIDNLIQQIGQRFPEEKKNISDYLHMVQKVSGQLHLISKMKSFFDPT